MVWLSFLKARLERSFGWTQALAVAAIALVLTTPSLVSGFATDDYHWLAAFQGNPGLDELPDPSFNTFSFSNGDSGRFVELRDRGIFPWWTSEHWKISFWRPLSTFSHWIDYRLFGLQPLPMHLHSIALYALLCLLLTRLYQRHQTAGWIAGLAGLLFAVDSTHGLSVGWLSNRNAVASALFCVATLLCHDSWRSTGRVLWGVAASASLLAGLMCGEGTVAALGYLFAHATFLDRSTRMRRFAALTPYVAVVVLWRLFYSAAGHGASEASFYTDPLGEPGTFLYAVCQYLPLLVYSQFALPDPIFRIFLSPPLAWLYVGLALAFIGFAAWAMWPMIKRDPVALYYAVGMVLAAIPYCSAVPQSRLLMSVGIGGMGLLARFLGGWLDRVEWSADTRYRTLSVRTLIGAWIWLHLAVAPICMPINSVSMRFIASGIEQGNKTLPLGSGEAAQDYIFVNATSDVAYAMWPFMRSALGQPLPRRFLTLYSGVGNLQLSRKDNRTITIRAEDGWMDYPWAFLFCRLPDSGFDVGDQVEMNGLTVTVREVNANDQPTIADFRFEKPLDSASIKWWTWDRGAFEPFKVPPMGQSTVVAGPSLNGMLSEMLDAQLDWLTRS